MDLLRFVPTLTAAALMAAASVACAADDTAPRSKRHGTDRSTTSGPYAGQEPRGLQPLRPDEVVVDRAAGPGEGRAVGVAGDLVITYAVCESGRSVRVRTDFPRVAPQHVPCDGVVSRAQIYTEPGRSFQVDVQAPPTTSWQLLVTRRSE